MGCRNLSHQYCTHLEQQDRKTRVVSLSLFAALLPRARYLRILEAQQTGGGASNGIDVQLRHGAAAAAVLRGSARLQVGRRRRWSEPGKAMCGWEGERETERSSHDAELFRIVRYSDLERGYQPRKQDSPDPLRFPPPAHLLARAFWNAQSWPCLQMPTCAAVVLVRCCRPFACPGAIFFGRTLVFEPNIWPTPLCVSVPLLWLALPRLLSSPAQYVEHAGVLTAAPQRDVLAK